MGKTQIVAEPGVPQIVITREFDAPRELLFRAHVVPEMLVRWVGPRNLTMTIDQNDVRDGGKWRFVHRDGDGNEYGFRGIFHGDPSPDSTVRTFEYEGAPGHVSLETLTFAEQSGKTLLRVNAVYQSVADRDAMIASGMEDGVNDGYVRLDELTASLALAQ
jgi:uncharacterized protein YndB with AHSA1/START domain